MTTNSVPHLTKPKKNVAAKIQLISCTMTKEIDETNVKTQNTFSGQIQTHITQY